MIAVKAENAEKFLLAQKRNAENGAKPGDLLCFGVGIFRILQDIGNVNRPPL